MTSELVGALRLALPILRADLRTLVELGAEDAGGLGPNRDRPPLDGSLDDSARPMLTRSLSAIRACEAALGERVPGEDDPAWLNSVIDGRIVL